MTQETCSFWKSSEGHCCPDGTHQRDCIYAGPTPLKVKAGGTYLNGYGRPIGPLEWDMVSGDLFFGPNAYSETGRCTTAGSRLNDLRSEYTADQTEARQHEATGLTHDEVAAVVKSDCEARQHSDQMRCDICDLTWDMNDPVPQQCGRDSYAAPPPVKPFPWRDFISLTGTHLLMFGIGAATVLFLLGV